MISRLTHSRAQNILLCAIIAMLMPVFHAAAHAADYPAPTSYVNDYSGVIDDTIEEELNTALKALQDETSAQVAVAVVDSIAPENIDMYSVKLFEKWGVGQKGKDNGVLMVVALHERKMRIEVGYGLEGAIPDSAAGAIRDEMTPYFKNSDYTSGISIGVQRIVERILVEYNLTAEDLGLAMDNLPPDSQSDVIEIELSPIQKFFAFIIFIIVAIVVVKNPWLLILLLNSGGSSRGGGGFSDGGGSFGGGFGGFGGGGSGGGGASGGW